MHNQIDLEIRLAYQEDMIESLNQVIIELQKDIALLKQQNSTLNDAIHLLQSQIPYEQRLQDERPPHY